MSPKVGAKKPQGRQIVGTYHNSSRILGEGGQGAWENGAGGLGGLAALLCWEGSRLAALLR
jgi:hypothetical protein